MTGVTPVTQIAMAMATDPGVYALLCGSGLSHGALIPTGWQVQVDLVRTAAAAQGIDLDDDDDAAVEAFAAATGVDPGYSELLGQLGATPTARRALLTGYFEPTDDDRAEGRKAPTAAHHAIARLAADGAVRVILTTNFDDLIEQALTAAGVPHTVWATDDDVAGAAPLEHQRVVVVIKAHGDYRQPASLRNTRDELDAYPPALDTLLDQVLDHFGLVVVGWSADWDPALAAAIRRAPSRRYPTWWAAHHGHLSDAAGALSEHRSARVVPIDGADEFLPAVADAHRAVRDLDAPTPADRAVARRQFERRLADPQGRIDAERQLLDVAHALRAALRDHERFPSLGSLTADVLTARVQALEALAVPALELFATAAGHTDDTAAAKLLPRALAVAADVPVSGPSLLLRLPALVCWYGVGTVLVDRDRLALLRQIATLRIRERPGLDRRDVPLTEGLHPVTVTGPLEDPALQVLAQGPNVTQRYYTPRSMHLERLVREPLLATRLVDGDDQFEWAFDRFEFVVGLFQTAARAARTTLDMPMPLPALAGVFGWRGRACGHTGRYPDLSPWVDGPDILHAVLPDGDPNERLRHAHLADLARQTRGF